MPHMLIRSILGVAALSAAGIGLAAEYSPRQYYSGWQAYPQTPQVAYRHYYYKPTPEYSGYKHNYVMKVPHDPEHLYYYNPYSKKYWGRCPIKTNGKPLYSLLAEKDRKADLKAIPPSAFPAPGPLPPLPESTDGARLDLPPDDLPMLGFQK